MHLLAENIAGNKDAPQMLLSARKWRNEPAMAAQVWNSIFDFLLRVEKFLNHLKINISFLSKIFQLMKEKYEWKIFVSSRMHFDL